MPLLLRADIGPTAFNRMLRDGCIVYVSAGAGRPADIPESAHDRAAAIAPWVPTHTILSGLAGLWVWDAQWRPHVADVVGTRGLHRPKPGASLPGWEVRCHSGRAIVGAVGTYGPVRVAEPARCAADALRWAPLDLAIPAVMTRIQMPSVPHADEYTHGLQMHDVRAVIHGDDPRGAGHARTTSAWSAIESVLLVGRATTSTAASRR